MLNGDYVIAVDWGTSYLRAYLCRIDQNNRLVRERTVIGLGVCKINGQFEAELFSRIDSWVDELGKLPILLSGQIGSSLGWQETQYVPCPAKPKNVASSCLMFSARGHTITIVPGLNCRHYNGHHDVMRGEELQILGWLEQHKAHKTGQHLICLPGTHTKWVLVNDGEIILFKTAMTGELYDLLCNNSVLIQPSKKCFDQTSFEQGASYTLNSNLGSFSHGLFSTRTKQLFNELKPEFANAYLSGMLIGSDVRAAANAEEWSISEIGNVAIIGSEHLSEQFSAVLNQFDVKNQIFNVEKCSIAGFSALYQLID